MQTIRNVCSLLLWRYRVKCVVRSNLLAGADWELVSPPRRDFLNGYLWRAAGTSLPTHLTPPPPAGHCSGPRVPAATPKTRFIHLALSVRPKGRSRGAGFGAQIALVKTDGLVLLAPKTGSVARIDRHRGFTREYVRLREQASRYLDQVLPWHVNDQEILIEEYVDGQNATEVTDADFLKGASRLLHAYQNHLIDRPSQAWMGLADLVLEVHKNVPASSELAQDLLHGEFLDCARRVPCVPMHTEMRRRNIMIRGNRFVSALMAIHRPLRFAVVGSRAINRAVTRLESKSAVAKSGIATAGDPRSQMLSTTQHHGNRTK
jgi:hypothetical protein